MTKRFSLGVSVSAVALLALGLAPITQAAETKGPVTDEIGVVEIPEGAPIVIGGYWTLSGPDTALGLDQKRCVEVAFDEIGNELVGHPIQFIVEDSQCNAEGGQVAATKLAIDSGRRRGARARLLELGHARRADPVERRDRQHRHVDHGALAHRSRPQAGLFRLSCGRSTAMPMPASSTPSSSTRS